VTNAATQSFWGSANGFLLGAFWGGAGLAGRSRRAARRRGQPATFAESRKLFSAQGFNWCKSCAMIQDRLILTGHKQREERNRHA
tara:strand:- start:632 stop:886 length:255 start_codon:yes stop_codon:yes gene_type:complete